MPELETLQKENKKLKELLGEVYEMSFLNDMIDDLCKDRNNDGVLLSYLSLQSEIQEVLNLSMTKKTAEKVENDLGVKVDRSLHLQRHNGKGWEKL